MKFTLKFNSETFIHLTKNAIQNFDDVDCIAFDCRYNENEMSFYAWKDTGYKVEINEAFTLLNDKLKIVEISEVQKDILQNIINDVVQNTPEKKTKIVKLRNINPHDEYGVQPSNFY